MLGAGVWTTTAIQSWTNADWEHYMDAGFEYEQIWTTWRLIQPAQDQFNYSSVQGQIDYVKAHNPHAKFFARLQGIVPDPLVGNSLNDSTPPAFTNFTSKMPSDSSAYLKQVKAYVRALVSEYAGQIDVWVTPIEINRIDYATAAFNLATQPYTLQDAIEIDRVIAEAVKEANPNATLILGTSTPLSAYEINGKTRVDPIIFEQMAITAGVPFDDVAIEVYAFSGDLSFWFRYLNEMSKLGRPIFINEAGASSEGLDYAKMEPARTAQDSWYVALLTLSLALKPIVGFFILEFKDRTVQARYSQFENMGLVDSSGRPKPSYQGIQLILQTLTRVNHTTSSDGQLTVKLLAGNYTLHTNQAEEQFRIVEGTNQTYIMQIENNEQLTTTIANSSAFSTNNIENDQMPMQLITTTATVSAHQSSLTTYGDAQFYGVVVYVEVKTVVIWVVRVTTLDVQLHDEAKAVVEVLLSCRSLVCGASPVWGEGPFG
jgi:GH35 family endo-1,4-beta-xylanase